MTSSCLLLSTGYEKGPKESLVAFWLTPDEMKPLEGHFLWPGQDLTIKQSHILWILPHARSTLKYFKPPRTLGLALFNLMCFTLKLERTQLICSDLLA